MQTNSTQCKNVLKCFIHKTKVVPMLLALMSVIFSNTVAFGQLPCDNGFSVSPTSKVYVASITKTTYIFNINLLPVASNALSHWGFQGSLLTNTGEYLSTAKNIL